MKLRYLRTIKQAARHLGDGAATGEDSLDVLKLETVLGLLEIAFLRGIDIEEELRRLIRSAEKTPVGEKALTE